MRRASCRTKRFVEGVYLVDGFAYVSTDRRPRCARAAVSVGCRSSTVCKICSNIKAIYTMKHVPNTEHSFVNCCCYANHVKPVTSRHRDAQPYILQQSLSEWQLRKVGGQIVRITLRNQGFGSILFVPAISNTRWEFACHANTPVVLYVLLRRAHQCQTPPIWCMSTDSTPLTQAGEPPKNLYHSHSP